jgi:hypothetical protein
LATARGYGLVQDESGNSAEYLGDAKSGVASGIGAMIVQVAGQTGPVYYDGEFSKGLPDGVAEIEKAGEKASLRKFKAGIEIGKATESQWKKLEF